MDSQEVQLEAGKVQEVIQTDLEHVWHPMLQHSVLKKKPPKLIVTAKGSTVVDAEGQEFLDAMAGLWCVNVGYGRTEIAEAVHEQMLQLPYFPHTQVNKPAALLADRLADLAGGGLRHTYFVNSGSEANEAAMKFARQYQRQVRPGEPRYKFISRWYSYHGTTLATLAAGGIAERKTKFGPYGTGFVHIPPAYTYRSPFPDDPEKAGNFFAEQLEFAIRAEGAETVAAVIIEPIQSGMGILIPPENYLPQVKEICQRYGVLLIFDEVINGFGRTGKWFAHHNYGVTPDIMSVAKGITSGYQPLAAVMTTEEVFEAFLGEPGQGREAVQVNTWGGHAAACAAGLANLKIMEEEDLPGRAAETGAYLLKGLKTLLELPIVGDVRGIGLLCGVELVEDKESKKPLDGAKVNAVIQGSMERGVIFARSGGTAGGFGNTVCISPPLVLTREEADRIVDTLRETIKSVM